MFNREIHELAATLGTLLEQRAETVTTAESCTGGLLAGAITSVGGSSQWFRGGYITYDDAVKQKLLGVRSSTLSEQGAVSELTVREMAEGAILGISAQWAMAISGIAGPSGAVPGKPVGTVWFGLGRWLGPEMVNTQAVLQHFEGDRQQIRERAVEFALQWLVQTIETEPLLA